jgi:hypothetical protein
VVIDHSFRTDGGHSHGKSKSNWKNAATADSKLNDDSGYYDPTKLKFVFSTPSPLTRKFIELRDKAAVLQAVQEEEGGSGGEEMEATMAAEGIYDMTNLESVSSSDMVGTWI